MKAEIIYGHKRLVHEIHVPMTYEITKRTLWNKICDWLFISLIAGVFLGMIAVCAWANPELFISMFLMSFVFGLLTMRAS